MTPRKRRSRIYWRSGRAWADFREFRDVGGRQEALVAPGQRLATDDVTVAEQLVAARLAELREARRRRAEGRAAFAPRLDEAVRDHLLAKKRAGRVTDAWLAASEAMLRRAVAFFGAARELETIRARDVRTFLEWLQTITTRRKAGRLSGRTLRAHLFALSQVYARAIESELVPLGYNPVSALLERPAAATTEARWFQAHDAALLLESARTLPALVTAAGGAIGAELAYPLVATFLLTGGRRAEVFGLEIEDVSFDRRIIDFRPNAWRGLKTAKSQRTVPLWPQLAEILQAYVFGARLERGGRLLFPTPGEGPERMLVDVRKLLDRIGERAGFPAGEVRTRAFRHSYTTARLCSLDRGRPVSVYTVSRELGHGSIAMLERTYAHFGEVRHRSEVVEFRLEQHAAALGDRLHRLGFVTTSVTTGEAGAASENPRTAASDCEGEGSDALDGWARRDSNARPLAPEANAGREPPLGGEDLQ